MAHVHQWRIVGAVFDVDGSSIIESRCPSCGATAAETTAGLNPGIAEPRLEDPFLYDDPDLTP